jgi:quinone-modifying oxidoreductase subunit QmoB
MARVCLVWVDQPGLQGLDPTAVASAAGLPLDPGGAIPAAVVTAPEQAAPPAVRSRLAGKPVQWLDLAGEIGGGSEEKRMRRAAAAVARAAGRAAKGTLSQVYTPQPAQTVLVTGAGLAAVAAARQAGLLGHPVILATPFKDAAQAGADDDAEAVSLLAAQMPAQVEVLPHTELSFLSGAAGDFTAELMGPQGKQIKRFGAVVLAPPGDYAQPQLGLDPAWAKPLEALQLDAVAGKKDHWLQAAVIAGADAPATADTFACAVETALALQSRDFVQTYLIFSEARVATPGGERLYREARQAGVIAARVNPGALGIAQGGKLLKWRDPLLGDELELKPDLLAIAGAASAPLPEFMSNQVLWPEWQWLVPESPRFSGGRTARSGLYIIGALRGTAPGQERQVEAAAAAADLNDRLTQGRAMPVPSVRHTLCASCLTCVRVCAHGVPHYGAESIECAPAACVACGMCAAECPAEAIAPPGWSNPELTAGLEAGLAKAASPKLVLFACAQSGAQAFGELSRQGHEWPEGLLLFPLPCAGRVGMQLIMKALSSGADGVLVAGCHDGNCRSVSGNLRARLRVGETAELLEKLGLGPERVSFLHLASNQPRRLAQAVDQFVSSLG